MTRRGVFNIIAEKGDKRKVIPIVFTFILAIYNFCTMNVTTISGFVQWFLATKHIH